MYAGKQLHIQKLDDVLKTDFADEGFVRWGVDYLVP
jgi:hypothetical protein